MQERVRKIISGGQTGADFGGLLVGRELGIPTGGTAPKGWITEDGPNPVLESFGLEQSMLAEYRARTHRNVENSDITIIISVKMSPGTRLTENICKKLRRPYILVHPDDETAADKLRDLIVKTSTNGPIVLNVAGNRESKVPGIQEKTINILKKALTNN